MKTYNMILLAILISQQAYSQAQTPAKPEADNRIYFYPDEPAPRALFKGELVLWPNPASVETKVSVKNMAEQAIGRGYQLQVHSTDGRLHHQQGWSAGQLLDVSGFADGMYIVTIKKGDVLLNQKLVVKRR